MRLPPSSRLTSAVPVADARSVRRVRLAFAVALAAAVVAPAASAAARPPAQIAFEHDLGIFRMDANGSHVRRLTEGRGAGEGPTYDRSPEWSPDGRRIAFTRQTFDHPFGDEGPARAWAMKTDGSNEHAVLPDPGPDVWESAAGWTPGGQIVLQREQLNPEGEVETTSIYVADPDGRHRRRLVDRSRLLYNSLGVSPGGRRFVFSRRNGDRYEVWTMNLDGSNRQRLTARGYAPSWGPDGRRIVFSTDRDHHGRTCSSPGNCYWNSELYVMRSDGSHQRRVTHSLGDEAWADWSADGTRFVFERYNGQPREAEAGHIYSVGVSGACSVRLTRGHHYNASPSWRSTRGDDPRPDACR
jgi:Tol biopolymer transport system component